MFLLILIHALLYLIGKQKQALHINYIQKNWQQAEKNVCYIKKMEISKNLAPDPIGFPQMNQKKIGGQLWKSAYHLHNTSWEMFGA